MSICQDEQCTGCGACAAACPSNCISFQFDNEGFRAPVINEKQCTHCNLCKRICPSNTPVIRNDSTRIHSYACHHIESNVVKKSSSGGAFTALAEYVFSLGGLVYGCMLDCGMVFHTRTDGELGVEKLHGSKYVQSDTKNTFLEVKTDLNNGRIVLYSGCPCQIAGLYAYLGMNSIPNLITVDLVCHGIGSPVFFQQYVQELSETYDDDVTKIDFRNKELRSRGYVSKITFERRKPIYLKALDDDYMSCYLQCAIYRRCCYSCSYANITRVGDFTLGDFVGADSKVISKKEKRDGISLLLTNNKKAEDIYVHMLNRLVSIERPLNEASSTNLNLVRPSIMPKSRVSIFVESNDSVYDRRMRFCRTTLKMRIGTIVHNTIIEKIYRRIMAKL